GPPGEPLVVAEGQRAGSVHQEPGQQEHPQVQVQAPDEVGEGHIFATKNANKATPRSAKAAPHRRVTRISHHIHKPDRTQKTIATMTRSTVKAQVLSTA